MRIIFLLLISFSGFSQAKKDTVAAKPKPKTQAEIAASLTVVFQGQNQINALLSALDKSDAPHNSVIVPLTDIIYQQINKQLPDSMKLKNTK